VDNEETRYRKFGGFDLIAPEFVSRRVGDVDRPTVKHVQPQ
jgi:hypothetical protein